MFWQNFCLVVLLISQIRGICSAAVRNASLVQPNPSFYYYADAEDGKFVVSVRVAYERKEYGHGFKCGGSLISDALVLTSANCLFLIGTGPEKKIRGPADLLVSMGTVQRYKADNNTLHFKVRHIVSANDNVALLVLHGKVPKDHPTIAPITTNSDTLTDGTKCKVFGWEGMGVMQFPEVLQAVDLPLITLDTCAAANDFTRKLDKDKICAGFLKGGPSPCQRDSGGPLICERKQVGVLPYTNTCDLTHKPIVFTDVAKYKSWIAKHIYLNGGPA